MKIQLYLSTFLFILLSGSLAFANVEPSANKESLSKDKFATSIYSEDIVIELIDHDDWHFYKIEVDTAAKLTVKLRKISDDADLYVSRSKKPTDNDFQCAPKKSGKLIETCRLSSSTPVIWYIGVHGKLESDYQLGVTTNELNLVSIRY